MEWYVAQEPERLRKDPSRANGIELERELENISEDPKIHHTEILRQLFLHYHRQKKRGPWHVCVAKSTSHDTTAPATAPALDLARYPAHADHTNNNRAKEITCVDLNYVVMRGKDNRSMMQELQGKLGTVYSVDDIEDALNSLKASKVTARWSLCPMAEEDLVEGGDALDYEENKEYPVLEMDIVTITRKSSQTKNNGNNNNNDGGRASATGGGGGGATEHTEKMCQWKFCVHALNEHGKGDSLILEAIRSAVDYKGFRKRDKVLTGFTFGSSSKTDPEQ